MKKMDWRTDPSRVTQVLPFLKDIKTCAWRPGIVQDRSGGAVPGPSAVFMRGYAVIGEANANELGAAYQWIESEKKTSELEVPDGAPQLRGRLLESAELNRKLLSISSYPEGRILFSPDDRFVYFDVIKN